MHPPEARAVISLGLLLAGAAISSLILINTWDTDNNAPRKPELSLAYYLDKAELMGTGPDGNILYQVWTEHAEQAINNSGIDMQDVRMMYGPPDGMPWALQAKAGRIPADASVIELHGNVIATSGANQQDITTIRTEQLDIDPVTLQANTQRKVIIEYNGRKLNATGMQANFETNQLRLLSNVNGKFAP